MTDQPAASAAQARSRLRLAALVVAAAFLLVGVLGFVPGITTSYDRMQFLGYESGAALLGLFQVSILHNLVHLLFGPVGIAMARTDRGAGAFLVGGGVVYLVLLAYGLITANDATAANFIPLNSADNWLHLGLGAAMIGLGLALRPRGSATS